MKVTLKEIADKAGVSLAATSLALNNKKGVNSEKAAMIKKVANDLGYFKGSSVNKAGETILFVQFNNNQNILNDIYKIFIADYYDSLTKLTDSYSMNLETKVFTTTNFSEVVKKLNTKKAFGIIFLGAGLYKEDIKILSTCEIPSVFIDVHYYGLNADFIDMNNYDCVEKILMYLSEKKYKNIGFVQNEEYTPNFTQRETAFYNSSIVHEKKINILDKITISGQLNGINQFINSYKALSIKPNVVFCANDTIAYNVIHACYEMDIKMPQELAIIGFDDLPTSSILNPQLSTINISRGEIIRLALEKLIDKIENPVTDINSTTLINGKLVIRKSC